MKLPEEYNLYKHNEYLDDLFGWANNLMAAGYLREPGESPASIKEICDNSLRALRQMSTIITHLELVIDEVLKLPGVSDDI